MLEVLEPAVGSVVVTLNGSPRAMPVVHLADLGGDVFGDERVTIDDSLDDALSTAVGLADAQAEYGGAGVLVTGSVVTVGEARTMLHRG